MNKRILTSIAAVLVLAACSDNDPLQPTGSARPTVPHLATAPVGARWNLFGGSTPASTIDATGGWEVATRFRTSKAGKIVGFRFYRADGETGANTAKLWTDGGTKLGSASFSGTGNGWQTVMLATPVNIGVSTSYRVSVNTNAMQVKTFGALQNNPMVSGPLTADFSYYGQPTGAMPTQGSYSTYFIDVIFEEAVPLPNLYVGAINPTLVDAFGNPVVVFSICNNGAATSAATTTRYWHWVAPWTGGGSWVRQVMLATPSIAAGSCYTFAYPDSSPIAHNEYHVWADVNDVVYESNEADNYAIGTWNRNF
ncbi:MAG: Flagellar hook-length control protein FliK [Gemmatimonadetes bacterium]|nr:Flagellar hook-length control protein FliK [Gemmatimonadota bacterium]